MKQIFLLAFLLISASSFGQTLKFKISGQKDTTVHLVRYFGKGLYYADTAELKNGFVEFDGKKQKAGILGLYIPGKNVLEFIYNGEPEVSIETEASNMMGQAKVKESEENKIFLDYARFIGTERAKAKGKNDEASKLSKDSKEYKKLIAEVDATTEAVKAYQLNIVEKHWDKFVGRLVKMSMDVEIPEAPKDEEGNVIDSTFRFKYYRAHFFDNIDFKDDRLVRTPVFHNKLKTYFDRSMMVQHWDTVLYHAFNLCDQFDPKSEMFQYCVSWITSSYEKSKIMGMDKVFVHMAQRYYCSYNEDGKPTAFWMPEDKLETLCKKAKEQENLVMGAVPPNLILRDTTDVKWKDFYSLKSEYIILYFWDPECGHCKKITPKLQTLYEKKFRERNIEIFAVGKAVGEDFDKWKAFIKKNNLEFINVAVTDHLFTAAMDKSDNQAKLMELLGTTTMQSLNYQKTYDIYATPKMWVLNNQKKIIAKSLTVSQLEDLMDRLQGKADLEKIFPPEEEPEDEKIH